MNRQVAAALVALALGGAIVAGQTTVAVDRAKRLIMSTAADALIVRGGIQVDGSEVLMSANARVSNGTPSIWLNESDETANSRLWRITTAGRSLFIQAFTDALGGVTNPFQITRENGGTGIESITLRATSLYSDGRVYGPDGSNTLPGYSFASATSSGMYFSSPDGLGFAVGGGLVSLLRRASSGSGNNLSVTASANGTGSNSGSHVHIGRNTSGNGSPGMLDMEARNGTHYYFWADFAGDLRTHTSPPSEATGSSIGTVVGTQTSTWESKNIHARMTDTAAALATMRRTPVYSFNYKSGAYNGEEFVGITTRTSPEFGMDGGKAFNPVTSFGTTVLALQELDKQIAVLRAEIAALKARR